MSDRFMNDFTGRDFNSILAKLDEYFTELIPEWTSRDDHDLNWATAKGVAYLLSIGMFYIDLAYSEQDPSSVQLYRNALRLAKIKNFPAKKYIGATTRLTVTIAAKESTYFINRGVTFDKYVCYSDASIPIGETTGEVDVIYGAFFAGDVGISKGTAFQKFEIDRTDIEDRMLWIYINDVEWRPAINNNLINSYSTEKVFKLVLNEDNKYEVHFGDGFNGAIPKNNAEIKYKAVVMPEGYLLDNYGNLPAGNLTKSSDTNLLTVTQTYEALGGGDRESIESIGRGIIEYDTTTGRIQSTKDAEILAKRVAGVEDAKCSYVDGALYLYIIPIGGGQATPSLIGRVSEYLEPLKIEEIDLNILATEIKYVNVTVAFLIDDKYHRPTMDSNIKDIIKNFLDGSNEASRVISIMNIYSLLNITGIITSEVQKLYVDIDGLNNIQLGVNQICRAGVITTFPTGGFTDV